MVHTTQVIILLLSWIHCIDLPKTFTLSLLLKSKLLDFEILSHVRVNRIEYVSYRQGSYRIRIVPAADRFVPALEKCLMIYSLFLFLKKATIYQALKHSMLPLISISCHGNFYNICSYIVVN